MCTDSAGLSGRQTPCAVRCFCHVQHGRYNSAGLGYWPEPLCSVICSPPYARRLAGGPSLAPSTVSFAELPQFQTRCCKPVSLQNAGLELQICRCFSSATKIQVWNCRSADVLAQLRKYRFGAADLRYFSAATDRGVGEHRHAHCSDNLTSQRQNPLCSNKSAETFCSRNLSAPPRICS